MSMEIRDELRKLPKSDKVIIGKMMSYLYSKSINQFELKNMHAEIVGMAAEGALRGEKLETICGPDYKKFCDDLSENCLHKSKLEVFLEVVMILSLCFSISLTFVYLLEILLENPAQWNGFLLTIDANKFFGILLVPALCGGLGTLFYQRNSFSKPGKTILLYSLFYLVSYFILRVLSDIFFKGEITIHALFLTITSVAVFLLSFLIKRAVATAGMKRKQHV